MFQCFLQAAVFTRLDCTKHSWSFWFVREKNFVLVKWEITEMMCLMTSQGPVHPSANIGLAWTCSDSKSVPFHMWHFIKPLWKQKLHEGRWKWKVHYFWEKCSEKMPVVHFTVLYWSRFADIELQVMVNAARVSSLVLTWIKVLLQGWIKTLLLHNEYN